MERAAEKGKAIAAAVEGVEKHWGTSVSVRKLADDIYVHSETVNRIRELPQNNQIVAAQIDGPIVLIWDIEAQPNRHAPLGAMESHLDLLEVLHNHRRSKFTNMFLSTDLWPYNKAMCLCQF